MITRFPSTSLSSDGIPPKPQQGAASAANGASLRAQATGRREASRGVPALELSVPVPDTAALLGNNLPPVTVPVSADRPSVCGPSQCLRHALE